jgi:hypothetical protein
MKNNLISSALLIFTHSLYPAQSYITYKANPAHQSRLGDCLCIYARARWFSYKYNIPLLYSPFPYSDFLQLSHQHQLTQKDITVPQKTVRLLSNIHLEPHAGLLYLQYGINNATTIPVEDRAFITLLRQELAPLKPLTYDFSIPQDRITIAMHYRRGGGFDGPLLSETLLTLQQAEKLRPILSANPRRIKITPFNPDQSGKPYADALFPLKFPAHMYYVESLKEIAKIFNQRPLHVHLFTDHSEPETIVKSLQKTLSHLNISFAFRANNNTHNANVLEDLYGMQQFDCLIRSGSYFSLWASVLHDYAVLMALKKTTPSKWILVKDTEKPRLYRWQIMFDNNLATIDKNKVKKIKQRVDNFYKQ